MKHSNFQTIKELIYFQKSLKLIFFNQMYFLNILSAREYLGSSAPFHKNDVRYSLKFNCTSRKFSYLLLVIVLFPY